MVFQRSLKVSVIISGIYRLHVNAGVAKLNMTLSCCKADSDRLHPCSTTHTTAYMVGFIYFGTCGHLYQTIYSGLPTFTPSHTLAMLLVIMLWDLAPCYRLLYGVYSMYTWIPLDCRYMPWQCGGIHITLHSEYILYYTYPRCPRWSVPRKWPLRSFPACFSLVQAWTCVAYINSARLLIQSFKVNLIDYCHYGIQEDTHYK